jgi:hypothetical protein
MRFPLMKPVTRHEVVPDLFVNSDTLKEGLRLEGVRLSHMPELPCPSGNRFSAHLVESLPSR